MDEPPLVLSQEGQLSLQELMVEGDLMEVSLEETNVIWGILQATRPNHLRSKCNDDEDESETDSDTMRNLKERVARSKRVFEEVDISTGNYPSTSGGSSSKKLKVRNPKDKKNMNDKDSPIKGGRKRRTRRENGSTKKSPVNQNHLGNEESSEEEDDDDDEDELCAVSVCGRPSGSEVDWVQCDSCELWFHMDCVGLGKDDVNEEEDYNCTKCSKSIVEEIRSGLEPDPGMTMDGDEPMDFPSFLLTPPDSDPLQPSH